MAEERLIDDDKDRKYKIRKNADGEDELVIDDTPDEEEESDIPVFNVPVYEEDDEEAALLTPEQLAERERLKDEAEKARSDKFQSLLSKASEKLDGEDFEGAVYALSQAEELDINTGEFHVLRLKAYSRNFTDYLSLEKCASAAEGIREFADEEQKAEIKNLASGFEQRLLQTESKTKQLGEENEQKKAERRELFTRNKNRAVKNLACASVPFFVFLILAIVFSTLIFSAENGTFLILTIVFGALTLIAFGFTLFTLNRFWSADRTVRQNERDTSTKLGREYLASNKELEYLKRINSAIYDDIS